MNYRKLILPTALAALLANPVYSKVNVNLDLAKTERQINKNEPGSFVTAPGYGWWRIKEILTEDGQGWEEIRDFNIGKVPGVRRNSEYCPLGVVYIPTKFLSYRENSSDSILMGPQAGEKISF